MKTKTQTHTPLDTVMENVAILDLLTREGWSESVIDRVARALNAYPEMLTALIRVDNHASGEGECEHASPDDCNEVIKSIAKQAIARAEGKD